MEDNQMLIQSINPDDSIAAQQSLIPHLSHRNNIFLIYPHERDGKWWLDFAGKPEFFIVDTHPGVWLTMLLEDRVNFMQALENMQNAEVITQINSFGDATKYRINYDALDEFNVGRSSGQK